MVAPVVEAEKEEGETEKKDEEKKDDGKKDEEKKDDSKSDAAANSTETKEAPKPKKKVHRRALSFKYIQPSTVSSMSKDDFESSKTTIRKLDEADAERKLRDGLKNDLESYVFSTRSKIREAEEEVSKVS